MRKPITILHVESAVDGEGGSFTSLEGLVSGLNPAHFRSIVLCSRSSSAFDRLADRGFAVHYLSAAPSLPLASSRPAFHVQLATSSMQARRLIGRLMAESGIRFDLIHTNDQLVTNAAWISAARLCGIPVVAHERQHGDFRRVHRWLAAGLAAHVRISGSVDRHCRSRQISSLNDRLVYNGVQVPSREAVRSARHRGRALLRGLGIDPIATPVILVPATLAPWKGADLVLRAVAHLARRGHRTPQVVLAGGESVAAPNWPSALRRMSMELGIAERVHLVGFERDVAALMVASSVVVHGARRPEPFGRVPLEAQAWGAPLVAANTGAVAEVVGRDYPGLVPAESPAALAHALERFLTNPCLTSRARTQGRLRARSRFSLRAHVEQMESIFLVAAGARADASVPVPVSTAESFDGRNVA